jgi:hypothetical protein
MLTRDGHLVDILFSRDRHTSINFLRVLRECGIHARAESLVHMMPLVQRTIEMLQTPTAVLPRTLLNENVVDAIEIGQAITSTFSHHMWCYLRRSREDYAGNH